MEGNNLGVIVFTLSVLLSTANGRLAVRGRIVAGRTAIPGQFPFYVLIRKHSFQEVEGGGSLISREWVLTATHVVERAHSVLLVFGITKLSDENALTMKSENIYAHPAYKKGAYDIALIRLPEPVPLNDNIQPINVPAFSMLNTSFDGERITVIGFGFTGDAYPRRVAQDLQYTHLPIIDRFQCSDEFDRNISEVIICAKRDTEGSTCNGDSGGPAVIQDENGDFLLIGITAFGYNHRCELPFPVGLTRVTSFLDWINGATGLVRA